MSLSSFVSDLATRIAQEFNTLRTEYNAITVEIDFGTKPVYSRSFNIVDARSETSSRIVVSQSGKTATNRIGDDTEWDALILSVTPTLGQFTVTAQAFPGPVVGKRVIQYQIFN